MTKIDLMEIADRQNEIIKLQSDVINDLFKLLGQYMAAEEIDKLEVVNKVNLIAQLRV